MLVYYTAQVGRKRCDQTKERRDWQRKRRTSDETEEDSRRQRRWDGEESEEEGRTDTQMPGGSGPTARDEDSEQ